MHDIIIDMAFLGILVAPIVFRATIVERIEGDGFKTPFLQLIFQAGSPRASLFRRRR